ncbi:MAG: DUF1801 domain-containing protein [Bacteroidetes bacterium]|nr:DUF1801 domain-containing protein [Bacteroidota bacterium]
MAVRSSGNPVDGYISAFPEDVRRALQEVRKVIRETVPEAVETIKYGMPAYVLKKNLVFFAGYKNHVGFYPAPVNEAAFEKALTGYITGRGSVQFPLSKPMPLPLIRRMVKHYVKKQTG